MGDESEANFEGILGEVNYVGLYCPKCGAVTSIYHDFLSPFAESMITCPKCHAQFRTLGANVKITTVTDIPQNVEIPLEFLRYVCEDCSEVTVPSTHTKCPACVARHRQRIKDQITHYQRALDAEGG